MKYLILVYGSQQDYDAMAGKGNGKTTWTSDQLAELGKFMEGFNQALVDSGELITTQGLSDPVHARRIEVSAGKQVVTDGPYAETTEVLAGYWLIDVDSYDRATEIAAGLTRCPGPADAAGAIDIRPVMGGIADLEA